MCVCVCVCVCVQRVDKLIEYDDKKEKVLTRDDIDVPEGWLWKGDWGVDRNRAVDDEGKVFLDTGWVS